MRTARWDWLNRAGACPVRSRLPEEIALARRSHCGSCFAGPRPVVSHRPLDSPPMCLRPSNGVAPAGAQGSPISPGRPMPTARRMYLCCTRLGKRLRPPCSPQRRLHGALEQTVLRFHQIPVLQIDLRAVRVYDLAATAPLLQRIDFLAVGSALQWGHQAILVSVVLFEPQLGVVSDSISSRISTILPPRSWRFVSVKSTVSDGLSMTANDR